MGFQNGNDNSQQDYNIKADVSSRQRTSVTAKKAQDTTKCQYERLSKTGPLTGGGE